MRAQSSVEYFIIVGIVMFFIIPVWLYASSLQDQAGDQLTLSYAQKTVTVIADTSSLVYSQGPPAKVPLTVYIPSGVEGIAIFNRTISMNISSNAGYTDVWAESNANMSGSLPTREGYYKLSIEAIDGYVNISY